MTGINFFSTSALIVETGLYLLDYKSREFGFKFAMMTVYNEMCAIARYKKCKCNNNNLFMFVCYHSVVTTSIDSEGSDLGQVHDAFFIGIEDEAKERLERLAASKRITPVDITKLAHQVCFKLNLINTQQ